MLRIAADWALTVVAICELPEQTRRKSLTHAEKGKVFRYGF